MLRQALDEYKDIYLASRNFAQRTRVEYLNDLDDLIRFLEQLGIRRVGEIGLPQLERYLAELDHRGLAGLTRKRKVVSIRSFLWYLYQDRYISINLAKRLIPPLAEARSPRYLTKSECDRLLEASAHNPRDFALIQVLLQTGIKLSELTRLFISDAEFPTESGGIGSLFIRGGERRKPRTVPLNQEACHAINRYLQGRLSTTDSALFVNRFEAPLGARGAEKIVHKYLAKAYVSKVNAIFGLNRSTRSDT